MGDLPRFRLLGLVQAWFGEEELDVGGPLQRALLARLLLDVGRVVSREQLIDTLWGEDPPPRAARSLETKVSRLRAALGESVAVIARGGGYVLEAAVDDIDAHRFERGLDDARSLLTEHPEAARTRLNVALSLWRGGALGGVAEGALTVERARLEDQRLEAFEALIDARLALGEAASLVGELWQLHDEHPSRERFTEQLMLSLYRSGRQADALEAYRGAYRDLRDELGLEPGPRLRELEQAILRQDESLGPVPFRARLVAGSRRRRAGAVAALACVALLAIFVIATVGKRSRGHQRVAPGLILVDAASGAVRASVATAGSQGATRFAYGHFWTLGDNGVMAEVDARDGALVRLLPLGVTWGGIAVGAGGIWVTDRYGPLLLRVDPLTGKTNLRRRLSTRGLRRPEGNMGVAIGGGSLWVGRGAEAVDRLDPSSLRLQHRIVLGQRGCELGNGGGQCPMAAGDGHIWVAGGDGAWLARIDEATNRVRIIKGLHPFLCCVAYGGGSVWVAEAHDIARLTPDGRVLRRYPVGSNGIGDVSFDRGSLWATADSTGDLLRIDSRTGRLSSAHLGNLLLTSAFAAHGTIAVSAIPLPTDPTRALGPRVLRIGLADELLNTTDPAVTRSSRGTGRWQWQLHHAICAGLYTRPDGADRQTLVPELASGPARASPDGRTWTIAVRTDFRFSPPLNRTVTAEDVRATIVRALSPALGASAPAAGILREVVGLAAYRHGRAGDVSGISLHHRTLRITTRRPVRDLPARLALPYFCVLPAGTPTPPGGYDEPLPTAGPYYLAEHTGGSLAVLRPNPGYRGTRPRHLTGIVFRIAVTNRAGVTRVRNGQLDYYDASTSLTPRRTTLAPRVSCRTTFSGVPGLDLAALCLRPNA